ncbi:hypothetical protein Patl1_16216 [Pistacia atlantica]|uniref:Uncharacterized protein n=1 Tax=Pistacia atlantica TaxID=434234 RepID=A0ACC1B857_9ROSI|nr:hypothetical protein Patl1_16216 [Pistacia atlantica]
MRLICGRFLVEVLLSWGGYGLLTSYWVIFALFTTAALAIVFAGCWGVDAHKVFTELPSRTPSKQSTPPNNGQARLGDDGASIGDDDRATTYKGRGSGKVETMVGWGSASKGFLEDGKAVVEGGRARFGKEKVEGVWWWPGTIGGNVSPTNQNKHKQSTPKSNSNNNNPPNYTQTINKLL